MVMKVGFRPVNQQDLLLASFSGRHMDTSFQQMVILKLLIGGGQPFWDFNITNRTKNKQ